MRGRMNGVLIAGGILLGALSLGGCATKKYVNEEVGRVDTQVQAQGARIDELDKTSREALERAMAAGKLAEGKFLYAVVLSDDSIKFALNKWKLTPDAESTLTSFADRLKGENKNVYVEIQGHTDSTGADSYNDMLGGERAEAVRQYLNKQGVALNRMGTISYGEAAPVAPNDTRDGRAQNRRVVLVVLS